MPIELSVKVESKKPIRDLSRFAEAIPDAMEKALDRASLFVAGRVQKDFLQGPRPTRLRVDSGRLKLSISNFVERPSKTTVRAFVGSNAISDSGVNYPLYWEIDGSRHGGPRPFLVPAVDQNRNKTDKIIRTFMKRFLEK